MFKTIAATSVLAGAALAQVQSPLKIAEQALQFLSSDCQQTLVSFANTSSPLYQCMQIDSLLPAVMTNGTIIEDVDDYLSAVCYSQPCSPALLNQTAMALIDGCGKDLSMFGISNSTVEKIFEVYPLARDVACLKNNQTEVLSNATIPINMGGYNTTNGTFCLTELATNLTGYLGVNLTNSYVDSLILGGNYSAFMNLANIPPTAICSDCIFAGYDMISAQYPQIGMTVVDAKSNMTVNSYLNSTCMATNMTVTSNGTLPYGVNEAAVNASETTILPSITATIDVTSIMSAAMATGSMTSAPSASSAPAGQMAEKRRWIGQQ